MTACSTRHTAQRSANYSPGGRYYPPPGPPEDPWGPYIKQASGRFGVPDIWIREVMRRESAGRPDATSSAGAMGLMQVMPGTFAELQMQHRLDDDPYEPRNNILAGTAYLRTMYDRFGAPGFLAAYNAGPRRLDDYLSNRGDLPDETINYVAAIAPRLGQSTPMSGPLAVYADVGAARVSTAMAMQSENNCDPDAAYDPTRTCAPGERVMTASMISSASVIPASVVPTSVIPTSVISVARTPDVCDPDEAYDPAAPCQQPAAGGLIRQEALATPPPLPMTTAIAPTRSYSTAAQTSGAGGAAHLPRDGSPRDGSPRDGSWAVQVGAFTTSGTARLAAERARGVAHAVLQRANVEFRPTAPIGNAVLYRARLTGLSANEASGACATLIRSRLDCMVVRPDGGYSR